MCAGPSKIIDKIVTSRCPTNCTLDYETARIYVARLQKGTAFMTKRCIDCDGEYVFSQRLEKFGLLASGRTTTTCSAQSCFKPAFRTSHLCKDHLVAFHPPKPSEDLVLMDQLKTALAPAIAITWQARPTTREMLALFASIRAGTSSVSDLIFLDLEFNSSSRQVWEVGMCNAKGEVVLDCWTKYSPVALQDVGTRTDQLNSRMQRILKRATSKHSCRDLRMTARQVANKLRTLGITPQTTFVTWHKHAVDLSALRDWLELEGEHGILPDDSHCVLLLNDFRQNLRAVRLESGSRFPLSLPILFPVFMGTKHPLAGRNHHAAVDAQQLYQLVNILTSLCKPPKDRPENWLRQMQTTGKSTLRQVSLRDMLQGGSASTSSGADLRSQEK